MEVTNKFKYYRGNLPHWQVGGCCYFVTFRSVNELSEEARECIKRRILQDHRYKFELLLGVIMSDHVHLLLRPLQKPSSTYWYSLSEILQGIKGSSARSINQLTNTLGSIWQKESFDRLIRNAKELLEKWEYIWNNPIKAGLSNGVTEYPFYIKP